MSLIVTGSIGIDTVITPGRRADEVMGGSCVYFAAAASFLTKVRIVAAVGEDFPDTLHKQIRAFDVDDSGLEKRRGSKTFRWTGRYFDNMNQRETLEVHPNVLAEKLPPVPPNFKDSRYVFLANTHPAGQIELRDQFPEAKLVVADTMDLWIETARPELEKLLGKIDGLVLNDSEATQLTGKSNPMDAADAIIAMGPSFVVVKRGEYGCVLVHKEGLTSLPAYPARKVIDPTGAGDSFAGGMMGYLALKDSASYAALRQSLAVGTVVASFNIEDFSLVRFKSIDLAAIEARLSEYAAMLRIEERL
ncbi:MAG: sugar kinase [Phycisphaeraceae bacterium]|nr:sugar kinase [Phycisphaeraceae bacterium]